MKFLRKPFEQPSLKSDCDEQNDKEKFLSQAHANMERIVEKELPRILQEVMMIKGGREDSILQETIKRLLIVTETERASSMSQLIDLNNELYLSFETFTREKTNFMETIHH